MSYALGLDPSRPAPAGLLVFCGFVPTVEGWTPDVAGRAAGGLRAFVAHGRAATRSWTCSSRRDAQALLEAGGVDVEYHESDAAHHIDPHHVPAAVRWRGGDAVVTDAAGPSTRPTPGSGCSRRTSRSRARWTPSWTRRTGSGCRRWSCWGGWPRRATQWPRLSVLARETGLSLSRVSRHMDALERRGLVQRRKCETDSRAVEASLTDAGRAVVAEAEAAHAAAVRERFLSQLERRRGRGRWRASSRASRRAPRRRATRCRRSRRRASSSSVGGNCASAHSTVSSSRVYGRPATSTYSPVRGSIGSWRSTGYHSLWSLDEVVDVVERALLDAARATRARSASGSSGVLLAQVRVVGGQRAAVLARAALDVAQALHPARHDRAAQVVLDACARGAAPRSGSRGRAGPRRRGCARRDARPVRAGVARCSRSSR